MYHPRREMAHLPQVPQIKNGKPDFSPTFQKVELRNSIFFPTNKFILEYDSMESICHSGSFELFSTESAKKSGS